MCRGISRGCTEAVEAERRGGRIVGAGKEAHPGNEVVGRQLLAMKKDLKLALQNKKPTKTKENSQFLLQGSFLGTY